MRQNTGNKEIENRKVICQLKGKEVFIRPKSSYISSYIGLIFTTKSIFCFFGLFLYILDGLSSLVPQVITTKQTKTVQIDLWIFQSEVGPSPREILPEAFSESSREPSCEEEG